MRDFKPVLYILFLLVFMAPQAISLSESLQLCYYMNESNSPAQDCSNNNYEGVWNGNVTSGVNSGNNFIDGLAYSFDDNDSWVNVTYDVWDTDSDYTVSFWMKMSAVNTGDSEIDTILDERDSNYVGAYVLYDGNGDDSISLRVNDGSNSVQAKGPEIDDQAWHFVTATWDESEGNASIWVNGTHQASDANSNIGDTEVNDLFVVGSQSGGANGFFDNNYYGGDLDHLKIYNRLLSSSEISDLYNDGKIAEDFTVTSQLPNDGDTYYSGKQEIHFKANITAKNDLVNASLKTNESGSLSVVNTTSLSGTSSIVSFNRTLDAGSYTFRFQAYNNQSNKEISDKKTFSVSTQTLPSVTDCTQTKDTIYPLRWKEYHDSRGHNFLTCNVSDDNLDYSYVKADYKSGFEKLKEYNFTDLINQTKNLISDRTHEGPDFYRLGENDWRMYYANDDNAPDDVIKYATGTNSSSFSNPSTIIDEEDRDEDVDVIRRNNEWYLWSEGGNLSKDDQPNHNVTVYRSDNGIDIPQNYSTYRQKASPFVYEYNDIYYNRLEDQNTTFLDQYTVSHNKLRLSLNPDQFLYKNQYMAMNCTSTENVYNHCTPKGIFIDKNGVQHNYLSSGVPPDGDLEFVYATTKGMPGGWNTTIIDGYGSNNFNIIPLFNDFNIIRENGATPQLYKLNGSVEKNYFDSGGIYNYTYEFYEPALLNGTSIDWKMCAVDDNGNEKCGSTLTFNVNSSFKEDNPAPLTRLKSPNNEKTIKFNTSTNFLANITDNSGVVNASLYTNESGVWSSVASKSLSGKTTIVNFSHSLDPGLYKWNIRTFDDSGQVSTAYLNRTLNSQDSQKPNISFKNPTPDDGAVLSRSFIEINASITDNFNVSQQSLEFDGTNYSFSEVNGDFYFRNFTSLQPGTYDVRVFAEDTTGNASKTSLRSIQIESSSNFTYSKTLNITQSSGNPTIQYKTFPFRIVNGSGSNDSIGSIEAGFSNINNDCSDLRFKSKNETSDLSFEIEECDFTTTDMDGVKEIWGWVRVPSLTRDGNDHIHMKWGDDDALNVSSSSDTWSSADQNYRIVQHFNEDPLAAEDSTSNNITGTVQGANYTEIGQFDGAAKFDGSDDRILLGNNTVSSDNNFIVSAWINTSASSNGIVIDERDSNFKGFAMLVLDTGELRFTVSDGNKNLALDSTQTVNDGNWHQVAGVWNETNQSAKIYIDGVKVDGKQNVNIGDSEVNDTTAIGVNSGGTDKGINQVNFFKGSIDEIEFYNSIPSDYDSWIKAEYDGSKKAGFKLFNQSKVNKVASSSSNAPSVDNVEFNNWNIGGNESTFINYSISDPDSDVKNYTAFSTGSVAKFTNTTLRVNGISNPFNDILTLADQTGLFSSSRETNTTILTNFSFYVENATGTVNESWQIVNASETLFNRGPSSIDAKVNFSQPNNTIEEIQNGFTASSLSGSKQAIGYWRVDQVETTIFSENQDNTSTSNTSTQNIYKPKQVKNNGSANFTRLSISNFSISGSSTSCSSWTKSLDTGNSLNVTCNASGDFIDQSNYSFSATPSEVDLDKNYTGKRNFELGNNKSFKWIGLDITPGVVPPPKCSQSNNTAVNLPGSSTVNKTIGFDCDTGNIGTPTLSNATVDSNTNRYWYNSTDAFVETNYTKDSAIRIPVDKSNLTDWGSRNAGSHESYADNSTWAQDITEDSNNVYITINTSFGSSSWESGSHSWSLTWTVDNDTSTGGGGSSGGGSGGGSSSDDEESNDTEETKATTNDVEFRVPTYGIVPGSNATRSFEVWNYAESGNKVELVVPDTGICRFIALENPSGSGYSKSVEYTLNSSDSLQPDILKKDYRIVMPDKDKVFEMTGDGDETLSCKLEAMASTGNLKDFVIKVDPATDLVSKFLVSVRNFFNFLGSLIPLI